MPGGAGADDNDIVGDAHVACSCKWEILLFFKLFSPTD
jgi:hypothetical protein